MAPPNLALPLVQADLLLSALSLLGLPVVLEVPVVQAHQFLEDLEALVAPGNQYHPWVPEGQSLVPLGFQVAQEVPFPLFLPITPSGPVSPGGPDKP